MGIQMRVTKCRKTVDCPHGSTTKSIFFVDYVGAENMKSFSVEEQRGLSSSRTPSTTSEYVKLTFVSLAHHVRHWLTAPSGLSPGGTLASIRCYIIMVLFIFPSQMFNESAHNKESYEVITLPTFEMKLTLSACLKSMFCFVFFVLFF